MPSHIGTIRLSLVDDDSIVDDIGNPLGGVGAGNGDGDQDQDPRYCPPQDPSSRKMYPAQ